MQCKAANQNSKKHNEGRLTAGADPPARCAWVIERLIVATNWQFITQKSPWAWFVSSTYCMVGATPLGSPLPPRELEGGIDNVLYIPPNRAIDVPLVYVSCEYNLFYESRGKITPSVLKGGAWARKFRAHPHGRTGFFLRSSRYRCALTDWFKCANVVFL